MNADPFVPAGGANAFATSVGWIEQTMLGSIATTLAIIAVALTGLLMLSGRIDIRRGGLVVIGCFVLFGAADIARGLRQLGEAGSENTGARIADSLYTAPDIMPPPAAYDPYAGAAVPVR